MFMLLNFFIIFLTINLLIFIHELGHYLCIKFLNFKVTKFVIGLGPKLISFYKNNILYEFGIFPFSGYICLDNLLFLNNFKNIYLSFWKKIYIFLNFFLIYFSGPFLNLFFSFLVFFIYFLFFGINMSPFLLIDNFNFVNKNNYYSNSYKILSINNNKNINIYNIDYLFKKYLNKKIYIKFLNLNNKKIFLKLLNVNKDNINLISNIFVKKYNLFIYKNKKINTLKNILLNYFQNDDIIYMINNNLIGNKSYLFFFLEDKFLNFKKKVKFSLIRNSKFLNINIPIKFLKNNFFVNNFIFCKRNFLFKEKLFFSKSIIFSWKKVIFLINSILNSLLDIINNYKYIYRFNSPLYFFRESNYFLKNLGNYLFFLSYLSINLFILNLLPLLPLDGGMLLFLFLKLFFYKNIMLYYYYISNILFFLLIFFIFIKDLISFFIKI